MEPSSIAVQKFCKATGRMKYSSFNYQLFSCSFLCGLFKLFFRYRGPELEIWALGVTLYILTFGENPFYDVEDTIKGQFSIPVPISEELNDLLHKMLDKNVETRITIGKLVDNVWINQPVCLKNYKFEEVVRCCRSISFTSFCCKRF